MGFDTWAGLLIRVLVVGVIILALIFYGSHDAASDEMVVRLAIVGSIVLIFPFVFAWRMAAVPAAMDAETAKGRPFVDQIRALETEVQRLGWQINPEAAKRSPTYIRLKFLLDPTAGSLAPITRIRIGQQEFDKLHALAISDDFEAYYTASFVAEWLRDNARKYFASSAEFQSIQSHLVEKLDEMHNYFRSRSSVN